MPTTHPFSPERVLPNSMHSASSAPNANVRAYSVAKLMTKHGRKGNMSAWASDLKGDCPKRDSRLTDRCDLICPDLAKVL